MANRMIILGPRMEQRVHTDHHHPPMTPKTTKNAILRQITPIKWSKKLHSDWNNYIHANIDGKLNTNINTNIGY